MSRLTDPERGETEKSQALLRSNRFSYESGRRLSHDSVLVYVKIPALPKKKKATSKSKT